MNKKISQKNLLSKFERNLKKTDLIKEGDEIFVALSGGPDSVCLFDLLNELKDKLGIKLSACHYNHKIRGADSDRDEEFVVELCRDRGVDLIKESHKGGRLMKSEQEAREARYDFFEKITKEARGAKIAIAHNSDDLAETFVFRLVRGSGPRGLKSIPVVREKFIRPLLDFSKDEVLKYLEERGQEFCHDKTNDDVKYSRNYIRRHVMPGLVKLNPKAASNIKNFSKLMEDQGEYIDKVVLSNYDVLAKKSGKKIEIDIEKFEKLEIIIQSNLLIKSASQLGYDKDISKTHIENILTMIENKEGGKHLPLPHSLRVEIKNGKIYLS